MIAWLLVAGVVLCTVAADLLQAREMKQRSNSRVSDTARSIFRRPLLFASLLFMAASFGCFVLLLRVADLSFAVPATAVSYVVETALAQWLLQERVGARRWTASLLVACGVAMLAL